MGRGSLRGRRTRSRLRRVNYGWFFERERAEIEGKVMSSFSAYFNAIPKISKSQMGLVTFNEPLTDSWSHYTFGILQREHYQFEPSRNQRECKIPSN